MSLEQRAGYQFSPSLEQDAEELVRVDVQDLGDSSAKKPLSEFLREASRIKGLQGIGLTIAREPGMDTFLSVYALTDLRGLAEPTSEVHHTNSAIGDLYNHFIEELAATDPTFLTELSFINTRGQDVSTVFQSALQHPNFSSENEQISSVLLAKVA